MFNYSGGMGARQTKPGPSATCYPTGVAAVPVEVLEAAMPIVFEKKELREGSGGAGKSRGGDGQTIAWRMRTNSTWLLNAVPSRTSLPPEGLGGGAPGAAGQVPRQRQAGERGAQAGDAARRSGDPRDAGRGRLRPGLEFDLGGLDYRRELFELGRDECS